MHICNRFRVKLCFKSCLCHFSNSLVFGYNNYREYLSKPYYFPGAVLHDLCVSFYVMLMKILGGESTNKG